MEYKTRINWKRDTAPFSTQSYNRTHDIYFGGGAAIGASSAPEFLGDPALPNPEELLVSAVSSCFMLTFLYWAAMRNITIDEYNADAVGTLAKNAEGKMAITEITIKPTITFHDNTLQTPAALQELFKKAHENCFISNSIKSKIIIESTAALEDSLDR